MKASIVIPAHNEEKYIATTLHAVCALSYPNLEIIVVDNASSDKTAEIVRSFAPRVTLVTEMRKGLLFAREAGRKAATGDVIVNIDADCLPRQGWLERGMAHFQNKKIVGVTGPYYYHDADTQSQKMFLFWAQKIFYKPFSIFVQIFHLGAILTGGNTFIRASTLEKAGGYNTAIPFWGEDIDTAKRIAKHGWIVWDTHLIIDTSARRFKEHSIPGIVWMYIANFFSITFLRNPI